MNYSNKKHVVIFASGNGSNALNLIRYFENNKDIAVSAIFCNKANAGIIQKAIDNRIAIQLFNKEDFYNNSTIIEKVNQYAPNVIVLAGFLWLVPQNFIQAFTGKIINLHPSLLPKYGGKGMYGHHVHEAVLNANETETGITIHLVNEEFDKGEILFQAKCHITENDSIETISSKIHDLEHEHLPLIIERFLNG